MKPYDDSEHLKQRRMDIEHNAEMYKLSISTDHIIQNTIRETVRQIDAEYILMNSMDPNNIAVKKVLPVVTYYFVIPYVDVQVNDGITSRETKYKREVLQLRVDLDTMKYSYWGWIDEIKSREDRWFSMTRKEFRRSFNTMVKHIVKTYGETGDIDASDIDDQMKFEF